ncbi:MAG: hypothetical protein DMF92_04205 [Acidobacteria bacterium]|nr:MAG: hypothetical protein DMF92_04205 [Acidobacteriota bacterium]
MKTTSGNQDGFEFVRRIRERPPEQSGKVPAIALTAYAGPDDRARALTAGFQVHLSKPVDFQAGANAASVRRPGVRVDSGTAWSLRTV